MTGGAEILWYAFTVRIEVWSEQVSVKYWDATRGSRQNLLIEPASLLLLFYHISRYLESPPPIRDDGGCHQNRLN